MVSLHDQQSRLRWPRRPTARVFLLADLEQSANSSQHQGLDGSHAVSTYLRRSEHHQDHSHPIPDAGEKGTRCPFGEFWFGGSQRIFRSLVSPSGKISPSHDPVHAAVPPPGSRSAPGNVSDADLTPPPEPKALSPRGAGAAASRKQSKDISDGDGTAASTRNDQRSVTFLPPILKKPRAGSQNQLPKTARVISPPVDDSIGEQSGSAGSPSTSNPAVEPPNAASGSAAASFPRAGSAATTPHATRQLVPPSPRLEKEPLQKPPKKRTAFVANSASNRRRPSAVRRKSSQSSSGSASKVTSPRLTAQAQERTIPESSVLELPRNSLPGKDGRRWTARCDPAEPFDQIHLASHSLLCRAL